jgi:hypothetical protein
MAIKESAELRDRMLANGTRVGRVVSSTAPMGQAAAKFHQHHTYAEVWEDGPRLRELKARQAGILARREELEKRKRQVAKDIRKADKELQQLQQRSGSSSSSGTSSAAAEGDGCGSSSAAGAAGAAGTADDSVSSAAGAGTTGGAAVSTLVSNSTAATATAGAASAGVSGDVFSSAAGSSGTAAAYSTAIAAAGTASTAAAAAAMTCTGSSTNNTLQQQQQLQQHDDDFDLLNADETVKLHMAHLKREEALLADERKRLEAEKAEQIRIWRRVTLEDRSRFCRQPLLGQRYLITTLLGKGGFSEVWRAFDLAEVREVAIKVSSCSAMCMQCACSVELV